MRGFEFLRNGSFYCEGGSQMSCWALIDLLPANKWFAEIALVEIHVPIKALDYDE
jgi:hypothetical protein